MLKRLYCHWTLWLPPVNGLLTSSSIFSMLEQIINYLLCQENEFLKPDMKMYQPFTYSIYWNTTDIYYCYNHIIYDLYPIQTPSRSVIHSAVTLILLPGSEFWKLACIAPFRTLHSLTIPHSLSHYISLYLQFSPHRTYYITTYSFYGPQNWW